MSSRLIFPGQHADVPTDVLISVYEQAAPRVEQVLVGLNDAQIWTRARGPNRWSIGEIVCHLADSEAVAAVRFRLIRSCADTPIMTYDQDALASELRYAAGGRRDLDGALRMFAALRASTAGLLRSWEADDWALSGEHPEWGPLTLRQLLELYADHGERHLDQILDNRARQRQPASLFSILSGRLDLSVAIPIGSNLGDAS